MTKHTIELIGDFTVTKGPRDKSWLAECKIDLAAIPESILVDLALHGLKQKIADAASGAEGKDDAEASMAKAADAILAGEWSTRGASEGVDEFTREARKLVRQVFKAKVGAKSEAWATFTGLDDAAQNAKLDELFAKNEAAMRPQVEAKVKELEAERKRKANVAVSFSL